MRAEVCRRAIDGGRSTSCAPARGATEGASAAGPGTTTPITGEHSAQRGHEHPVPMAEARPAHLAPEDRDLMTKDEDLHLVGSRVGRPGREGNQSPQEPVGKREQHESSLLRSGEADPTKSLVDSVIAGLCAPQVEGLTMKEAGGSGWFPALRRGSEVSRGPPCPHGASRGAARCRCSEYGARRLADGLIPGLIPGLSPNGVRTRVSTLR
jgi:hypothetical protein